jgi:DNA-binding NarL/FixJ family response regulator
MDISDSPNGPRPATSGGDVPAAASRAADDRTRLRASQAAITSRVIEYQLDRRGRDAISVQDIPPLSPREQEVIGLVAAGLSDGEIADRLFISKKTASVHVANIKSKLEASSRVEIALIAAQLGFDENDVECRLATVGSNGDAQ